MPRDERDNADDYSDLLSADERAEMERARTERSRLTHEPPAFADAVTQLVEHVVAPFKPYRRFYEVGSAPSPNRENDAGGFLKESRDYVFDPATLKRLIGSASPIPHFVAWPSPAAVPQFGGIGSLPPPVGGVAEASLAGVNLPADDLQRLLPLIRQIVREEIEAHERERYGRMRSAGAYRGLRFTEMRLDEYVAPTRDEIDKALSTVRTETPSAAAAADETTAAEDDHNGRHE